MKLIINNTTYHLEWAYDWGRIPYKGETIRTEMSTCKLMREYPMKDGKPVRMEIAQGKAFRSPDDQFIKSKGRKASLANLVHNISNPKTLFLFSKEANQDSSVLKKEKTNIWNQFREQSHLSSNFTKIKVETV